MKSETSADWQEVRNAYCNTAMPVRDICTRFNITRSALYRRIKCENWPRRKDAAQPGRGAKSSSDVAAPCEHDMVARLLGVFLNQLREAETAANAPGASATERERAGRALNVLLRNYEKLKEHEDMQSSKSKETRDGATGAWQSGEEERLRKEIYQRLARLVQKHRSERRAGKPESEGTELPRP
jgi:hypothetical protein